MSQTLEAMTAQHLSDAGIIFSVADTAVLRIRALDPTVGDIVISFEGGEISVFLGDITHRHFTPYKPDHRFPGRTAEQAAVDAVQFIREVVEDKWVLWWWSNGRGGCFKPGGNDDESANSPLPGEQVNYFRWSGPLVTADTSLGRR